ncbi:MAG: 30S ribosomal protein THX [Rhodocyclaceae bacterium]|nr:30S ribosomal protein THX [Rhodocyclaceae bacterium]
MGKGDRRTLRGKLFRGSYGRSRSHETNRPQRDPAPAQASEGGKTRS